MQLPAPRKIVKTVVRFIAARAVSTTISLIVEKNADPETKLQMASVHVGSFVLGEFGGDAVKPYIDKNVDDAFDMFKKDTPELTETPES